MKVLSEIRNPELEKPTSGMIRLPNGLIGFPQHKKIELFYQAEQLPFIWMKLHGPEPLTFVVIEPAGLIADYEPELFDEDAYFLGLTSAEDAALLNIVTLAGQAPYMTATVNLAGPIVINRRKGIAKQVVLANYSRYSAHHPLVENAVYTPAASNF
ncbi:MAG TPA: flagellar assembly protein FliW [Opitutaceae bacterium]|nr:flagellar assembly protein FliW [Opitutaceae bacterium]